LIKTIIGNEMLFLNLKACATIIPEQVHPHIQIEAAINEYYFTYILILINLDDLDL